MDTKDKKPVLILDEFNHTENDVKMGYTKPGWYFVSCDWKLFGPFTTINKAIEAFNQWTESN